MQQDLEFEIADNSNLVKKGPIHPNRPNPKSNPKKPPPSKAKSAEKTSE